MSKNTLFLFTTSPTGLGHIRVTQALIHGLNAHQTYEILGVNDQAIEGVYRLMSTNWILRQLMEFFQKNSFAEKLQTSVLTKYEHYNAQDTYHELNAILKKHRGIEKLIIISTHAQLGRRIQHILDHQQFAIPIFHTIIVTDDSPQRLWAICAPLVCVPSKKTQRELSKLFVCDRLHKGRLEVTPYPINPLLTTSLPTEAWQHRKQQLTPGTRIETRICIPISGAAVQLTYIENLIGQLIQSNTTEDKIHIDIVNKKSPYTKTFIERMDLYKHISIHQGQTHLDTIEKYDDLYHQQHPPSIEITKPSEQCFKVLTSPDTKGGVILLLTSPVGRQEFDNLDYLERFHFLPNKATHRQLYKALILNQIEKIDTFKQAAQKWRALMLPSKPLKAHQFIQKCLQHGIFSSMSEYQSTSPNTEISPLGVQAIYQKIAQHSSN